MFLNNENRIVKIKKTKICGCLPLRQADQVFGELSGDRHVLLQVASALWPQVGYRFLDEYLELLRKRYGVSVTSLDYGLSEAARAEINDWVAKETDGKPKA